MYVLNTVADIYIYIYINDYIIIYAVAIVTICRHTRVFINLNNICPNSKRRVPC